MPADAMVWFQVIIAVAISLAFYKLVEKPLLYNMSRRIIWKKLLAKKEDVINSSPTVLEPANASVVNY